MPNFLTFSSYFHPSLWAKEKVVNVLLKLLKNCKIGKWEPRGWATIKSPHKGCKREPAQNLQQRYGVRVNFSDSWFGTHRNNSHLLTTVKWWTCVIIPSLYIPGCLLGKSGLIGFVLVYPSLWNAYGVIEEIKQNKTNLNAEELTFDTFQRLQYRRPHFQQFQLPAIAPINILLRKERWSWNGFVTNCCFSLEKGRFAWKIAEK